MQQTFKMKPAIIFFVVVVVAVAHGAVDAASNGGTCVAHLSTTCNELGKANR